MANNTKAAAPTAPMTAPTAATTPVTTMAAQTEAAISFAKNSFEQVAAKSREAMEQGLKAIDSMNTMSRGNVEALLESSRAASGGFQSIAQEVAQYSKQSLDRTTAAVRSMGLAKTAPELMQMQSDFARAELATTIAETTRLSQAMFATMTAIFEPLQKHAMAAAQTKDAPKQA